MQQSKDTNDKPGIFDNPRNVQRLLVIFFTLTGAVLAIDLFYHTHTIFAWEEYFGFYAVYGFVACVVLVIVSKFILRPLVMRKEDYYD
jgi:hypothetical protein